MKSRIELQWESTQTDTQNETGTLEFSFEEDEDFVPSSQPSDEEPTEEELKELEDKILSGHIPRISSFQRQVYPSEEILTHPLDEL